MQRTDFQSVFTALSLLLWMVAPAAQAFPNQHSFPVGGMHVLVNESPFRLQVVDARSEVLLDTAAAAVDGQRPGPLSFAVGAAAGAHQLGYIVSGEVVVRWVSATAMSVGGAPQFVPASAQEPDHWILTLATEDPTRTITLKISSAGAGIVTLDAQLSDATGVIGMGAAFENAAGQRFLGFGERSDGADQTGREVVTWNEEGPFSAGDTAPVADPLFGDRWQGPAFFPGSNYTLPWFVSSRGYGLLLDSDWLNGFDLGATDPSVWSLSTRDPAQLKLRVYAGPTPADVVQRFTADALNGRQPQPAPWYFGVWLQPGLDVRSGEHITAADMRDERDFPVTVAQTYTHYLPCAAQSNNRGNPSRRQREKENSADWHSYGFKVTTYVNSFVCSGHPDGAYTEGDEKGYFIKSSNTGQTYRSPYIAYFKQDGPWHGIVDFTHAEAGPWWQGLIREALEDGYDGWMEDFGEYVQVDAVTADGRSGLEYHNRYCTDYHKASHELTSNWAGKDLDAEGFAQFIRCGYIGTAPYARVVWGADPSEDFSKADGLAAAVSQGISMGLSGIAYWGSDIGGFHAIQHTERTNEELQTRWIQLGAFSGIMRTQRDGYPRDKLIPSQARVASTFTNQRAEAFGYDVGPIFRKFAKLRTQLYPYVWEVALAYRETGMPMMRHLGLVYPDDPNVWSAAAEYQFLFGDDLLVAPVITEGAISRTVYLPEGEWVSFWELVDYEDESGAFTRNATSYADAMLSGGTSYEVSAPLDEIPLFVRAPAGGCTTLRLLPADVNTLADIPDDDASARSPADIDMQADLRPLHFGGAC